MASLKGWAVYGAIGLAAVGYNSVTSADRDSDGVIVSGGSVDAFDIEVGDCFNDASSVSSGEEDAISSIPAVPCSESHDNEVYAVFDVGMESFPEGEQMYEVAFDECLERFEPFVGREYDTSVLDIYALYPTKESWSQLADREVVCAVYDMNANKLTGSARGLGL